jgi:uncharacterized protein
MTTDSPAGPCRRGFRLAVAIAFGPTRVACRQMSARLRRMLMSGEERTMLTDDMIRIVTEQRLGFVASVDADGSPNLSPKGTMLVVDAVTIAFADIRSPGTARNVERDGRIEINVVDPFVRRGYRFKGRAIRHARATPGFERLFPLFAATWPSLTDRMRALVSLHVERALPVMTPPYDEGVTQDALRQYWTDRFRSLQPGGEYMGKGAGWTA